MREGGRGNQERGRYCTGGSRHTAQHAVQHAVQHTDPCGLMTLAALIDPCLAFGQIHIHHARIIRLPCLRPCLHPCLHPPCLHPPACTPQVGADVRAWFAGLPRQVRMLPQKRPAAALGLPTGPLGPMVGASGGRAGGRAALAAAAAVEEDAIVLDDEGGEGAEVCEEEEGAEVAGGLVGAMTNAAREKGAAPISIAGGAGNVPRLPAGWASGMVSGSRGGRGGWGGGVTDSRSRGGKVPGSKPAGFGPGSVPKPLMGPAGPLPQGAAASGRAHWGRQFGGGHTSTTIDQFYLSRHCAVCDELTRAGAPLCARCAAEPQASYMVLQVG